MVLPGCALFLAILGAFVHKGTLGAFCRDVDGELYGITAAHVIKKGKKCYVLDGQGNPMLLGVCIVSIEKHFTSTIDIALIRISTDALKYIQPYLCSIDGIPCDVELTNTREGDEVASLGSMCRQHTEGTVISVTEVFRPDESPHVTFKRVMLIKPKLSRVYAKRGDSGSLVAAWATDKHIVYIRGLLFAVRKECMGHGHGHRHLYYGIALPLQRGLTALEGRLGLTLRMCSASSELLSDRHVQSQPQVSNGLIPSVVEKFSLESSASRCILPAHDDDLTLPDFSKLI